MNSSWPSSCSKVCAVCRYSNTSMMLSGSTWRTLFFRSLVFGLKMASARNDSLRTEQRLRIERSPEIRRENVESSKHFDGQSSKRCREKSSFMLWLQARYHFREAVRSRRQPTKIYVCYFSQLMSAYDRTQRRQIGNNELELRHVHIGKGVGGQRKTHLGANAYTIQFLSNIILLRSKGAEKSESRMTSLKPKIRKY